MNKRATKRRTGHHFDREVDLHGFHVEPALALLDKLVHGGRSQSVLIIHGRGSGVLRKAVREYIGTNACVREYYLGEDINLPGGDGVVLIYI